MAGELFALPGPSGGGKTMVLGRPAGLEKPSAGRILSDGQDMPGGDRARLEGRIDEVACSGNTNHVYLENANRVPLSVTIRNQARTTLPAAPKGVGKAGGDELWMSWVGADTLVLTS